MLATRRWCSCARGDAGGLRSDPWSCSRGKGSAGSVTLYPLPRMGSAHSPFPFCSPTTDPRHGEDKQAHWAEEPLPKLSLHSHLGTSPWGHLKALCAPTQSWPWEQAQQEGSAPSSGPSGLPARTRDPGRGRTQTVPGHTSPAASILPTAPGSSPLLPTQAPPTPGSAAIVHSPSPHPGVVSGHPFSQNRKQVATCISCSCSLCENQG